MMIFHVNCKQISSIIILWTIQALVWFNICMSSFMVPLVAKRFELLIALTTFKWSFSVVNPKMNFEISLLWKSFATSGMRASKLWKFRYLMLVLLMYVQSVLTCECLPAYWALITCRLVTFSIHYTQHIFCYVISVL